MVSFEIDWEIEEIIAIIGQQTLDGSGKKRVYSFNGSEHQNTGVLVFHDGSRLQTTYDVIRAATKAWEELNAYQLKQNNMKFVSPPPP